MIELQRQVQMEWTFRLIVARIQEGHTPGNYGQHSHFYYCDQENVQHSSDLKKGKIYQFAVLVIFAMSSAFFVVVVFMTTSQLDNGFTVISH